MEFYNFSKLNDHLRDQILEAVSCVLDHEQFIMGPEVNLLETTLTEEVGEKYAVGFGSGTDALLAALLAAKVGPGDIVFVPAFTFNATAEVVRLLGAHPHFVDIDPLTLTMDPQSLFGELDENVSEYSSVRAIIAVDLFGNVSDYPRLAKVMDEFCDDYLFIADAAQALGSSTTLQKELGRPIADITCTSFFPTKIVSGFGDGGMCFTSDPEIDAVLRSIRNHGAGFDKYDQIRLGFNGRLDTIQAAMILTKVKHSLGSEIEARRRIAKRYESEIFYRNRSFRPQIIPNGTHSCYSQYSVIAKNESSRVNMQLALQNNGIPTMRYYPTPLPLQPFFHKDPDYWDYWEEHIFPNAVKISKTIFQIPIHPYLTDDEVDKVIQVLKSIDLVI